MRAILTRIARAKTSPVRLAERSSIVLMSAAGVSNREQARRLGCDHQRVRRWRRRWRARDEKITEVEANGVTYKELESAVIMALQDNQRSGAPTTFSGEQVAMIIAVACEKPSDNDVPVSHWSTSDLARTVVERKIVPSISARQVGRFLSEAALKPHRSRYWLTSPDKLASPEEYQANVERICDTYAEANAFEAQNVHVVSADEKTGIQALERKHATKPMKPGQEERQEFEYMRHGTLTLIVSFMVTSGIVKPTITETRGNIDFVEHIEATIKLDEHAGWIFVADRLNTHMSEELVRYVARCCGISDDLGEKGKRGILKSMKSRRVFLEDKSHRIRFVYTPRHASWLNQVEIWFSILSRRFLKRSSFTSLGDLAHRLGEFVTFFNDTLAKPFRWTYTGRPLQA